MSKLYACILFLLVATLMGCQPDTGCHIVDITPKMNVSMCQPREGATPSLITAWDSVTIQGVGCDSVLVKNEKNRNMVSLPLRPDTSVCEFAILYHGGANDKASAPVWDTIHLEYTNSVHFVSMECGCSVYQTLCDSLCRSTCHAIDSILILNSSVTLTPDVNLCICYR